MLPRIVLCLLMLTGSIASAVARDDAELYNFVGHWRNVNTTGDGVSRLDIRRAPNNRVRVQAWGSCDNEECSLGIANGRLFVSDQSSESDEAALLVRFAQSRVSGDILIRVDRRGNLITHALLSFKNRRGDVYRTERFKPEAEDDYENEDEDRYDRSTRRGDRYGRRN